MGEPGMIRIASWIFFRGGRIMLDDGYREGLQIQIYTKFRGSGFLLLR